MDNNNFVQYGILGILCIISLGAIWLNDVPLMETIAIGLMGGLTGYGVAKAQG